ncbi:MAG: HEPN domain-containing protein [Chitinophagaceae bacterium]|nr:HEPN domain-containing protein [Chitinophagaceae bacterium]
MKATSQENGALIPRIHSLAGILALISKIDPGFLFIQADTNLLEGYFVQFRYPGLFTNKADAKMALLAPKRICLILRNKLGL